MIVQYVLLHSFQYLHICVCSLAKKACFSVTVVYIMDLYIYIYRMLNVVKFYNQLASTVFDVLGLKAQTKNLATLSIICSDTLFVKL